MFGPQQGLHLLCLIFYSPINVALKNVCNLGMSEVFFYSYIRSNQKIFVRFGMECKSHIESFDLSDS